MTRIPEFYPQPERARLRDLFANPPREYGAIGFWFLNDDLEAEELSRQLDEFAAAGFSAVCPCARVGLSPEIGYLTPRWFDLMEHVVRRCAELGLKVVLYDEASYPSGSANGLVVARNPAFAARGLSAITQTITTDYRPRFVRLGAGRSLENRPLALIAGRLVDGAVDPATLRLLETDAHGVARLPAEPGPWRLVLLVDAPTGGRIRGAHGWQDDDSALAPAAANLLDPQAVAAFIELTHERYFARLGRWFGSTIVAMFTDEPSLGGRGARPDTLPWVDGLLAEIARLRGDSPQQCLVDLGGHFMGVANGIVEAHREAVSARLARVYYDAQRRWCESHSLALTGHPSAADEVDLQHRFSWPGQDTVWRWVLPDETALRGAESTAPRTASSVAAQRGITTVFAEVLGAYGWRLSLDEIKWLLDWHLVRGSTAFLLHALFYSIRGNRAYESEPDLGLHHPWWPLLPQMLTYLRRQVMMAHAWPEDPALLVVADGDADAAANLYQRGITFHYTSPRHLPTAGTTGYELGAKTYPALAATPGAASAHPKAQGVAAAEAPAFPIAHPGLRVSRRAAAEATAWFVVNESDDAIALPLPGWSAWDAWTGRIQPTSQATVLSRRQALWLTPGGCVPEPEPSLTRPLPISSWRVVDAALDGLGDWAQVPGLETWSGSLTYEATFETHPQLLRLDLGAVGEAATVWLNDTLVAQLFWAPYATLIPAGQVAPGLNRLRVRVTNSAANRFEGAQRPSGLIGPVSLLGA